MLDKTIRKATNAEIQEIQSLAREVIAARFPEFLGDEAVEEFIDSGQSDEEFITHKSNLYVLTYKNEIVGFSICSNDFVHLMMVRLNDQRSGHGAELLNWCERSILERGFTTGRLETFVDNKQAVDFYLKNGWSETNRDDTDVGVFARIWFEKSLG